MDQDPSLTINLMLMFVDSEFLLFNVDFGEDENPFYSMKQEIFS